MLSALPGRPRARELQDDHDRILEAVARGDAGEAAQPTSVPILHAAAIREREPDFALPVMLNGSQFPTGR